MRNESDGGLATNQTATEDLEQEIRDQGTSSPVDRPDPVADRLQLAGKVDDDQAEVEDLARQLAASESSNDDEVLVDADLPEGFLADKNGDGVWYKSPILNGTPCHLSAHHWRELVVESSIDPDLVRARGYWTLEDDDDDRRFLRGHGITPKALNAEHFPGLLVPMHRPDGDGATFQWKPAVPLIGKNDRPQKYVSQRGLGNRLDVHPDRRDLLATDARLWITEGIKKADALASRGELVIGLTGVWNWKDKEHGTVPDWENVPLRDRDVVLCWDADALEKPNVLRAMKRLGNWLKGKGAGRIRFLIVPAEVNGTTVKGADDFLAAGGIVDQLLDAASSTPPDTDKADDTFTDARLAERVADEVLAGRYCWTPALGWLQWDGRRWSECSDVTVGEAVRRWSLDRFAEHIDEARKGHGQAGNTNALDGWRSMLQAGRERSVLSLARGIVERGVEELDADPDLLNTPSGVVDLQTGQVRAHDPDLMMRKITGADYRPGHAHPDWTKALDVISEEVRDWFQLRAGQALTGHMTPDDLLIVNQGAGENGKTTIMDTLGRAAGDYYLLASDRVLLANPDQHPTELMDLQGVRLAVAEETPEARRLSVNRLKKTVGTPRITARKVHRDAVTFDATHSLFLSTNYRPLVEETDRGTWRRLALVRFPFTFRKPGEELVGPLDKAGDPTLRDRAKLDPEVWSAALAWMVEGARRWYELGRIMPPLPARVEDDTRDWRTESDQVLAYLDDRLRFDASRHVMAADLLDDLNAWLQARGHRPWSDKTLATRFGDHEEIAHHHVEKRKTRASAALSRPEGRTPYGQPFKLADDETKIPATYAAWHGLRFATDDDLAEELVDDPDDDPGQRDEQAAGGVESGNVPAVPADSKLLASRRQAGVSENPEHPEHDQEQAADDALDRLQDQLDDLLDWIDTIDPDPLAACPKCSAEELASYPDEGLTVCLAEGCDYLRTRASFTDWLLDQEDDHPDDYVRTLARDAANDPTWPDVNDLDRLARYIAEESGNEPQARQALLRAWSLWSGQPVDREDEVA